MDFKNALNELKNQATDIFKDAFGDKYEQAKESLDQFIESSKEDLKRWAIMFANGEIEDKEALLQLVKNQKDLLILEGLKAVGATQNELSGLKDKLVGLIVTKISELE